MVSRDVRATPGRVALALGTVYLAWGGTYLAIRWAIETIPPLLMAGTRFLLAGSLMYAVLRLRGAEPPRRDHWKSAFIIGALLLTGGNGAVSWAEQRVPSGLAALLVAMVPVWMVLLEWLARGGDQPGTRVTAGLVVGFGGILLLVGPTRLLGGGRVDPVGAVVLGIGSMSWALGSIYARSARLPASHLLATAMEMLAGGVLLVLAGLATGEAARLDVRAVSPRSLLSFGYLVVFGSWVGFSTYLWLLQATTPARAATYAYVNPIVAVLLGWGLGGEPLTPRIGLAAALIVAAVVLITTDRTQGATPAGRRTDTTASTVSLRSVLPTRLR